MTAGPYRGQPNRRAAPRRSRTCVSPRRTFRQRSEETRGADVRLAPEAMRQLPTLSWPGDVAQLRKVLADTVALQRSGTIGVDKLPAESRSLARR